MVHIRDKPGLFREVLRVLRPGGTFVASDWLKGENADRSPELASFQKLAHLSFRFATAAESAAAMRAAGFRHVVTRDRNRWYADLSRYEVEKIEGPLKARILEVVDQEVYSQWLEIRRALADSVAVGALRPTHLRGFKP